MSIGRAPDGKPGEGTQGYIVTLSLLARVPPASQSGAAALHDSARDHTATAAASGVDHRAPTLIETRMGHPAWPPKVYGTDDDRRSDPCWDINEQCDCILTWQEWYLFGDTVVVEWSFDGDPPDLTTPGTYQLKATYKNPEPVLMVQGPGEPGQLCPLSVIDPEETRFLTVKVVEADLDFPDLDDELEMEGPGGLVVQANIDTGCGEATEEDPGLYINVNRDADWDPIDHGWTDQGAPPNATYTPDKDRNEVPGGDDDLRLTPPYKRGADAPQLLGSGWVAPPPSPPVP